MGSGWVWTTNCVKESKIRLPITYTKPQIDRRWEIKTTRVIKGEVKWTEPVEETKSLERLTRSV